MEQKNAEREIRQIVREEAIGHRKKEPAALEVQVQELRRKILVLNFCVILQALAQIVDSISDIIH